MLGDLGRAKIVITNYHAFKLRETIDLSKGGRSLLQGRGPELQTLETEGQMLQRVMPDLMGIKNVLVLNDEAHPRVLAYVKNHSLGLEVPYRHGSESRRYLPDFVVLVDDGKGDGDLLHFVVEIKGYRGEDAKEKKAMKDTYWVPGVNNLGTYGRWAFAEFRDVYEIEADFAATVETQFNEMIARLAPGTT